ncbi:CpsD/CapB family tyrosine-protein kinase [Achromobacter aloeverae]|uniref:Capsular biosynthesis protein n=1 Tax=Achromobacter aloeverae TaxID=1750518 RepID=A0A4Q1HGT1_9BURK|nr:CpsD/CapB family tyrosine-protein kinase [Achromobacter aloeverae]RXN86626.1 capsular biosynthesis protein [Achromobacter aloeverae]
MSNTALHSLFDRIGQPAGRPDAPAAPDAPAHAAAPIPAPMPVHTAAPAATEPQPPSPPQDVAPAAPQAAAPAGPTEKMGERFIRLGLLTEEQVQHVVKLQQAERLRFGQAAVKLGFVSEERVQSVLAEQYHYDYAPANQQQSDIPLAIASAPFSQEAEAIRQLRAEISIQLEGQPRIAIAIVSPEDGEGRAYLSASLAVAFAQTGRSTLLVNANLRASGQRDLLGASGGAGGLSSILAGRSGTGPCRAVPGFPKLAVLDAGPQPPNPAELLREPALGRVLEAYAGNYEIFIVNTPAMNHSSDAQGIARQVDACVMIARRDMTRLADLERAAQLLETAGVRVLGTVYNEYDPDDRANRGLWARVRDLLPGKLRR